MGSLIGELQRRNVFRVAIVYVIVGWVLLQLSEILMPAFGIPDWTLRFIVFVLMLGFPLALIFAWAFEMTPEGLKKEKDVDRSRSMTPKTGRKLDYAIIAFLVIAVVVLVVDNYVLDQGDSVPETVAEAKPQYSIAVLPFVNMSNDPDNEYFSEGLSEELLNVLAQIKDFKVAGRTSSFAFKGQAQDLREIGDKLGVNTVLEGSVRKAGNQVRITAQLVKVEDGFHLWSATYDRTLDNIFEVQGEIATAVVSALKQTLLGEEDLAVIDRKPTDNVEAYNHYLRGRFHMRDRTREQLDRAQEAFQLAVTLDPDFALAYSGLSDTYILQASYGFRNYEDIQPLAQAAVDRAMSIDDQLSEVWASQGAVYATAPSTDDITVARAALEKAVELNPNNAQAWMWFGQMAGLAQWTQGQSEIEKAYAIDPLHPVILDALAQSYALTGQYERAKEKARELLDVDPDYWRGYASMANISAQTGEFDEELRWRLEVLERDPDSLGNINRIGDLYAILGNNDKAEEYGQRALQLNPEHADTTFDLAYLDFLDGRLADGLALVNALLENHPENTNLAGNVAYLELLNGNVDRARELYRQLMTPDENSEQWRITDGNFFTAPQYAFTLRDTEDRAETEALISATLDWLDGVEAGGVQHRFMHIVRALAYGARGDRPEAVAALRAAAATGWPGEPWIEHDPIFKTLQDDLGFVALLDEMRAKRAAMRESLAAEGI